MIDPKKSSPQPTLQREPGPVNRDPIVPAKRPEPTQLAAAREKPAEDEHGMVLAFVRGYEKLLADHLRDPFGVPAPCEYAQVNDAGPGDLYVMCDKQWRPAFFFNDRAAAMGLSKTEWYSALRRRGEMWHKSIPPSHQLEGDGSAVDLNQKKVRVLRRADFERIAAVGVELKS